MSAHARLIAGIDSHDRPQPTQDNGDGTLTIFTAAVDQSGILFTGSDTIPATLAAACNVLGY